MLAVIVTVTVAGLISGIGKERRRASLQLGSSLECVGGGRLRHGARVLRVIQLTYLRPRPRRPPQRMILIQSTVCALVTADMPMSFLSALDPENEL